MVNNDITRRIHRWGGGAALAGTALFSVGVIGVVHADRPARPEFLVSNADLLASSTAPTGMLDSAIANYSSANDALGQIDPTVHSAFAGFISAQISTQSLLIQSIAGLEQAEDAISANSAPFGVFADSFFGLFNLGWQLTSEVTVALAQGMETALSNDLWGFAALAEVGLYVVDFVAFGNAFAEYPTIFASAFF